MATFEALLSPGLFRTKDKDPEQFLQDWDLYVKAMEHFLVATGKEDVTDRVKLSVLQSVGGPDVVDLVEVVGNVQQRDIPAILAVAPAQGVAAVQGVAGVPADDWETALRKIREGIIARTNQAMSRLKLYQEMHQGDQMFVLWSKEVIKQAKRVDWSGYGWEAAARDAILFQTVDGKLRQKILAQDMTLDQAIAWGKANEDSRKKADRVEKATGSKNGEMRRLKEKLRRMETDDKKSSGNKSPCKTCTREHNPEQTCWGLKATCYDCDKEGHFRGAEICKGKKEKKKEYKKEYKPKDYKGKSKKKDKKKKRHVKRLESSSEEEESSDDETSTSGSASSINRVEMVGAARGSHGTEEAQVKVHIRPREGKHSQEVEWTADSGVGRSLISERDWEKVKETNAGIKLDRNDITFKPYSTDKKVPVKGKAKVVLRCEAGKKIKTTVYIVQGEKESLLGKKDAEALGIISLYPKGSQPERVRKITPIKKEKPVTVGTISGNETQAQIDQNMDALVKEFKGVFKGTGKAKVPPIHINMKENAKPVAQKQRPVPIHLMGPLKEKLKEFKKAGIVEGPLGQEHATGWVHNVVLTGKKYDPKAIRLNLDTRLMNKYVEKAAYPIPTAEQVRHRFIGSDRYSVLDLKDGFHQFEIDKETQELFKFTTPEGIYKYKRLVMGTPPASGECHGKMQEMLRGLKGVEQIKDDVIVHGAGKKHDIRLRNVLQRLSKYGVTLKEVKCKFGRPAVLWFGHIFSKEGMSPDPEKVDHIRNWPEPEDKTAIKSFLQTVQFVSTYMRDEEKTYSDITAPLRKLTSKGTHYNWTKECQTSFDRLKEILSSETVLMNYDPERETRLYVDHGPEGIAATVAQGYEVPNQREKQWRTVHHTGRSLQQSEKGYTKMEGESLGIYSGILMNKRYLHGAQFTVVTDHQGLVPLYNSPNRPAPTRVE